MKLVEISSVLTIALLTGCSTLKGGIVTETMTDKKFVSASPEERKFYLNTIQEEEKILSAKKEVEYASGRPVFYGDKSTGYTIQWNKKMGLVSVYPGHITNQMGMESSAMMVLKADEKGDIDYQTQGGVIRPTTLLSNVATQEGLGRVLVKGGFQVLGAGVNGALAAQIQANKACGNDCGNITMVNTGGNAGASSKAQSQSGTTVDINAIMGSCPNGVCLPIPE